MGHYQNADTELRVGIAGCGNVAEYHARFLQAIPGVKLVGIADVRIAAAEQFAQRHGVATVARSVDNLLDTARLDVLHVTTPPEFHYASAMAALERGVHVFLEKPMAFTFREVTDLYERAAGAAVCLCPDFINLFHPRMRQVVECMEPERLGRALHIEAEMSLNLADELRESEGVHWAHRLPGGFLRDYTSHLLYLALYFTGWPNQIQVSRKATGKLPQGLTDHLTVQLEGEQCTASVLLSCHSKRSSYRLRVICENGWAEVDFESQTAIIKVKNGLPRKVTLALGSFATARALSSQAAANITNFMRGKLVPYAGLQLILPRFYDSIRTGAPLPISRELATAVTFVEEKIFAGATPNFQLRGCYAPSAQPGVRRAEKVLITGASGYVGKEVVAALAREGYAVRALVRATSSLQALQALGVEIFLGDVRSFEDVNEAIAGTDVVIHLAAGIRGSEQTVINSCVRGTQNVAKAASLQRVRRVIYMSSLSVYDFSKLKNHANIASDSLLEEDPGQRGAYSTGKRQAEDIALAQMGRSLPAWTILRPSLIVGRGRDLFAPLGPALGKTVICTGSRRKHLAVVHVSDVAVALLQLLQHDNTMGKVYTVSDPEDVTAAQYVRHCLRQSRHRKVRVVYLPYAVPYCAMWGARILKKLTGFGPDLSRRSLLSLYRSYRCSGAELFHDTGWQPSGNLLSRILRDEESCPPAHEPADPSFASAGQSTYAEASAHGRQ